MTMFTAFTESFRKQDICLYTECIGDVAPFGIVPNATTTLPTIAYSNGNTDAGNTKQPLGTMTMTLPSTANAVALIYPACGIYPAAAIPAGGNVDRSFRLGRGEVDVEARLKTPSTNANIIVTFGIGLPSDAAPPAVANDFVGFYAFGNQSTWTAALVLGSTVIRSAATTLDKGLMHELRVFLDYDANRTKLYANGNLIATFDGQLPTTTGLLPHIEIRDRTQTGSLATLQSVETDYFMVKLKANR